MSDWLKRDGVLAVLDGHLCYFRFAAVEYRLYAWRGLDWQVNGHPVVEVCQSFYHLTILRGLAAFVELGLVF